LLKSYFHIYPTKHEDKNIYNFSIIGEQWPQRSNNKLIKYMKKIFPSFTETREIGHHSSSINFYFKDKADEAFYCLWHEDKKHLDIS